MSVESAVQLQREITKALESKGCLPGVCILLDKGSEVTNLNRFLAVSVVSNAELPRHFLFITPDVPAWIFENDRNAVPGPEFADIYATGYPIIIVKHITGDSVVRGVFRYLYLEKYIDDQAGNFCDPPPS